MYLVSKRSKPKSMSENYNVQEAHFRIDKKKISIFINHRGLLLISGIIIFQSQFFYEAHDFISLIKFYLPHDKNLLY